MHMQVNRKIMIARRWMRVKLVNSALFSTTRAKIWITAGRTATSSALTGQHLTAWLGLQSSRSHYLHRQLAMLRSRETELYLAEARRAQHRATDRLARAQALDETNQVTVRPVPGNKMLGLY